MITLHSINNPGSAFQAYALNKFLNGTGIENHIIDYRPAYSKLGRNKIKGVVRAILFLFNEHDANKKYRDFMKNNMKLTPSKYLTYKQLCQKTPKADVYISGSDQLWNADYDCGRDDAYYLGFVEKAKKIAYATSVGKNRISDSAVNLLCSKISDYQYLSVREKPTANLLSQRLSRTVEWVCDPVFLLDKDEYMSMCSSNIYGKYAVVYLSAASELLNEVIQFVKKKYGLTIIQAGGNVKRCQCHVHLKNVGPYDFLTLINNAQLVISSSFHATAFSHILHRNFVAILPEKNGERISSLLSLSELEYKIVNSIDDIDEAVKEADFNLVDERLKPFIALSKNYLLNALQCDTDD